MTKHLCPRARKLAVSPTEAATEELDRAETEEKRTLASAGPEPSRAALDHWTAEEARARAQFDNLQKRINELNTQIDLMAAQQRPRRWSVWRRWFPDRRASAELGRLRAERDELMLQRYINSSRHLRAFATRAREEKAFQQAVAEAQQAHEQAIRSARAVLTHIARARRILKFWPGAAFGGIAFLLRAGASIERAKENEPEPFTWSHGVRR